MTYFLGILAIILGLFMILKTEALLENFGKVEWAEQHMGLSGGSRLFYKLFGLALIILSMMFMTGMLGEVILSIFGSLFGIEK